MMTEPEITIRQYQDIVDTWVQTVGVRYYTELTNTAILMEEVGEVARIMARLYGDQSFKPGAEPPDLADEFADVFSCSSAWQTRRAWTRLAIRRNLRRRRDRERHQSNEKLRRPPSQG